MSLLDALLLDPYRTNVWISYRTDGVAGTGTQNDPYDGSTATKFDAVMNGLSANTRIHFGPGTFQTNGYADGVGGGWQPKAGMKIVGCGIDVTILQLAATSTNAHYYAVSHALSSSTLDYFEVSDLTIDCNLASHSGASVACGAVRVMGNHARVRRIKVINWGTKSSSRPCFVIAVITADPPSGVTGVTDCGIEECIAITPGSGNVGPVTLLHAGGIETAATNVTGLGVGPSIRNCFADAGQTSPFANEIRGLSMAWCKGGIVEGNQAHNMMYAGPFQQASSAQDVIARNNFYKNVNKGPYLGGLAASQGTGSLSRSGTVATVTLPGGHNLLVCDYALINTSPSTVFDGIVVTITGTTSTTFTFNPSVSATSATIISVKKVFGVNNLVLEGNTVELATATTGELIGIHAQDWWGTTNPAQDPTYPTYVFGKVIVRDNKIRYVDGAFASNYAGWGIQINGALDLLVRNNVAECAPTNPIRNNRCGSVKYFNDKTPAGVLIQGINEGNSNKKYDELETDAEDALVLALLKSG